jgi:hypothetical protein
MEKMTERKDIADLSGNDETPALAQTGSEVIVAMCVGNLTRRKTNLTIAMRSSYLPHLRKYWPSTIAGTGSWAKASRVETVCISTAFSE